MRLLIVNILFISCFMFNMARAGVVETNPFEVAAWTGGNVLIDKEVGSEIGKQTATVASQTTMALEFDRIHRWQAKYNSYLKTVSGYASSLKATTQLYNEGVRCFILLAQLKKAVDRNPQGIVATLSMNNLYIETAIELISIYKLLREAICVGGSQNMLTGAERSQTLWSLNDRLDAFNKKLSRLTLSIRYYTLNDVWRNITAGMLDRDVATIAREAYGDWRARARVDH